MLVLVEFPEEENFDFRSRLLLVAAEAGGEDLGIVEDEQVVWIAVIYDVLEDFVLDLAGILVKDHHTAFVAVLGGIFRDELRI